MTDCPPNCVVAQNKHRLPTRTSQESSIRVFRRFIATRIKEDGTVEYDASQVVSKKCYEAWLASRGIIPNVPEKIFQRSLTAHITSSDTRQPFRPQEEAAILTVLRRKRAWWVFLAVSLRQKNMTHKHTQKKIQVGV